MTHYQLYCIVFIEIICFLPGGNFVHKKNLSPEENTKYNVLHFVLHATILLRKNVACYMFVGCGRPSFFDQKCNGYTLICMKPVIQKDEL